MPGAETLNSVDLSWRPMMPIKTGSVCLHALTHRNDGGCV